jgi:hypothetical protein
MIVLNLVVCQKSRFSSPWGLHLCQAEPHRFCLVIKNQLLKREEALTAQVVERVVLEVDLIQN